MNALEPNSQPIEGPSDRVLKEIGLVAGPVVALLLYMLPLPLSISAHKMAALMIGVVVYWITEPIPIPVTALLGPMLAILLGLGEAKEILASFGHPVVFLFIGSFFIARAMEHHHLDRRISISVLAWKGIGNSPYRVLGALGGLTAFLSLWISNTAATAMLFPIALGILNAIGALTDSKMKPYATGMMLMIAFAASVGGIGTPIGTPPNLIGIGMIEAQTGRAIGFLEWMRFAVPIAVLMFMALYGLLIYRHPPPVGPMKGVEAYLAQQREGLGPWSRGEKNVRAVFCAAVFFWILPGLAHLLFGAGTAIPAWIEDHLSEEVVAILAAGLLFFLPSGRSKGEATLSWEEAVSIDWGTIFLFGGGLALGGLIFKTGLATAIGEGLLTFPLFSSLWGITAFAILLAIGVSELASNTASANMVIPVVIAVAQAAQVSPLPPALGAILGASYGFMLPVSTPPNAIVYGSGLIPITQMIRTGILFDLIGALIIFIGLRLLCPLLGLI